MNALKTGDIEIGYNSNYTSNYVIVTVIVDSDLSFEIAITEKNMWISDFKDMLIGRVKKYRNDFNPNRRYLEIVREINNNEQNVPPPHGKAPISYPAYSLVGCITKCCRVIPLEGNSSVVISSIGLSDEFDDIRKFRFSSNCKINLNILSEEELAQKLHEHENRNKNDGRAVTCGTIICCPCTSVYYLGVCLCKGICCAIDIIE